jgi:multisubunit Na+/H+ antiporter MnhB subunit
MRRSLVALALVLCLGAVVVGGLAGGWNRLDTDTGGLRRYFAEHGVPQTGSINLVSSIYLGYRAFDTLGETVILFLAVTGVAILRGEGK